MDSQRWRQEVIQASLQAVVYTRGDFAAWRLQTKRHGNRLPVILQMESGMSCLGFALADVEAIVPGRRLPYVGRASMGAFIIDPTDSPDTLHEGDLVDVRCPQGSVDICAHLRPSHRPTGH